MLGGGARQKGDKGQKKVLGSPALCASAGARGVSPDLVSLSSGAVPPYPLISWTQVATSSEYTGLKIKQTNTDL